MTEQPDRVDLSTPDLAAANRDALAALFPGVLADGILDATRLGELLDMPVTTPADGRERFGLMWAGKQEAVRSLLTPSRGTLIPDMERSVDFDNAKNVFIEGDNLEVLKLLQKAYNDKVDIIYIDPPYNTGNDFIYDDDFSDGLTAYLRYSGQLDEAGNRLAASSDTSGRLHSRWLSFMYPRLVLARNLLRQDGVLFVSIDDNEIHSLRAVLDEIFGEENLIAILAVEMSKTQGMKVAAAQNGRLVKNHEYVLVYSRNVELAAENRKPLYDASERYDDHYDIVWDGEGEARTLTKALEADSRFREWAQKYSTPLSKAGLRKLLSLEAEIYDYFVTEFAKRLYRESPISLDRVQALDLPQGVIQRYEKYLLRKNSKGTVVQLQSFADGLRDTDDYAPIRSRATIRGALWKGFHSDMMNVGKEGGVEFKNGKKPVRLIKQLIKWANRPDGLVLDFFAGSGTTGHAVAAMNAEDMGTRRFLLVQLPEPLNGKSDSLVSDLTWKRLSNVHSEFPSWGGVRSYRLGTSAFRGAGDSHGGELFDLSESTLSSIDRGEDALACEILLAEGVSLESDWLRSTVGDHMLIIGSGVAVLPSVALDENLVLSTLTSAASVVIFLEDGFAGQDTLKANAFTRSRELGITMKTV